MREIGGGRAGRPILAAGRDIRQDNGYGQHREPGQVGQVLAEDGQSEIAGKGGREIRRQPRRRRADRANPEPGARGRDQRADQPSWSQISNSRERGVYGGSTP